MPVIETKPVQPPLFFNHDGAIDDLVALVLLLTLSQYRVSGIAVSPGCYVPPCGLQATLRILDLFCRHDVEVVLTSAVESNPFPEEWCITTSKICNELLAGRNPNEKQLVKEDPLDFTYRKLIAEEQKTTVVLTGPATHFAAVLEKYPEVKDKIDRILWVAGAFYADGNVLVPDHDGSAEWNIYRDPQAAVNLLAASLPVYIFPIDAAKHLPVDQFMLYHLEKNRDKALSRVVGSLLEPACKTCEKYLIYDVLPMVYLGRPDLFQFESKSVNIELRGTSTGNIYRNTMGYPIKQGSVSDEEEYVSFILRQLKQF